MFIQKEELKSVMYTYQVNEITENDNDIVEMAIDAAVQEMIGYLRTYDTDAIFSATGKDRNPLVLELCKNMAAWYLIRLCNIDMIYTQIKEAYDRAIKWCVGVSEGKISPKLPILKSSDTNEVVSRFRQGSNPKFDHHYE